MNMTVYHRDHETIIEKPISGKTVYRVVLRDDGTTQLETPEQIFPRRHCLTKPRMEYDLNELSDLFDERVQDDL